MKEVKINSKISFNNLLFNLIYLKYNFKHLILKVFSEIFSLPFLPHLKSAV